MTLRVVRVRSTLVVALMLAAATVLLGASLTGPALAGPGRPLAIDSEGGTPALRAELEAATRGFNDAAARLEGSKARQAQLTDQMGTTESQLVQLTDQVGALAATAYKGGRVGGLVALLDSGSPDGFLQRAATLETKVRLDDARLRQLKAVKATLDQQQAGVSAELKLQQDQLAEMDKRRKAAEKALAPVGGAKVAGGQAPATAAAAAPAPRRPDGTFGPQSCSVKDPTTSGCLTQRTLNALQQARAAGFNRFTACYRPAEDGGEHPRGRACDFSASTSGFGGAATGADKAYGDNLANYFIRNASRLGVLYVIWYQRIWLPSSGWRAYNGGGSPSAAHTNHVHLSVQ